MAKGDFTIFEEAVSDLANLKHNLKETHVFKLALITSVVTPTAADATPAWAEGSGVDYDGNEVGTGGNYTANGHTLTYTGGVTRWAEAGGVGTFDADDISFAQSATGFTNARWGILYNDTIEGKLALGFLDLGGDVSEVDGPVAISWNAAGVLTITANPA
jgi:hypothetical protein